MKIQFSNLHLQHAQIRKEINSAIKTVIGKSNFILGEEVRLFEAEFARFCGTKYAVGVSSGTSALFLALKSLGIGQGDEVIVPAFTYIATAFAVSYTGAKPVFVDVDERTYNIDIGMLKSAINDKTKAIIPVHLYGQPAQMAEIMNIAKAHNVRVIEDSAQAHGAEIEMPQGVGWVKTGSVGDVGCFSFYPSKNLGAMGDGGMVVTNNKEIYEKVTMLRDCGRRSKYEHLVVGYNSRLDTLQAAILRAKLKRLAVWNKMRQKAAGIYNALLKGSDLILPHVGPSVTHVYHVYAIRTKKRDVLFQEFAKNKIGVVIHYPVPLHLQKAYAGLGYHTGDLPVSERVSQEVISLPMYPHLKEADIKKVVKVIKSVLAKN
ncbi:MAG: DegT/DnrJ/EryC1/StrS family aminotransferase [Candidatus Omnitrophota bacterium]